jgi:uncharacterized membrane protein
MREGAAMSDDVVFAIRFGAAIGCGLMAGLFFAFSVAVMRGLSRIPTAYGMAAMQSINVVILNPIFFTAFFGTAALCLVVLIASVSRWGEAGAGVSAAGAALYLVGNILITIVFNVPMNNALASTSVDHPDAAAMWATYLTRWTAWNHVRTVTALAAAILLTLGF